MLSSSSSSSSSSNQSSLTDPGINNNNKNRLVCVVAATGKQGSSICKNLIEQGFSVRGTTRDASSSKCDELKKLGVSMVSADMDDKRSLQNAFKGCWAVYSVTDFYQDKVKSNPELEYVQGKNTVDAAVEEKVQYFIYSALDNVKNISGGKLSKVFHFTNKNRVGEYAKQQNDIKTILVYPAFYMQNFQGMMPLKRNDQNQVVFSFPFPGSVRLPIVDCRDFGKVVAALLKNPDQYVGREIMMCGEYTSLHDLVAKFQGATNQPAIYYQCTEDEMRSQLPSDLKDEFIEMFRWFNEYGYYGGRNVEEGIQECERIVQQDNKHMLNFREWLISTGWKGPDKSMLQNIKASASHLIENVKHAIHH